MTNLINGRTAEEIKTALKVCPEDDCSSCSYEISYMCSDYMMRDALALIERLESERDAVLAKVPEWINAKKSPPTKKGYYIVSWSNRWQTQIEMIYFRGNQWAKRADEITHWMPLPKPPKEKERKE